MNVVYNNDKRKKIKVKNMCPEDLPKLLCALKVNINNSFNWNCQIPNEDTYLEFSYVLLVILNYSQLDFSSFDI